MPENALSLHIGQVDPGFSFRNGSIPKCTRLVHASFTYQVWWKFVHNILNNLVHNQTNRQTNQQKVTTSPLSAEVTSNLKNKQTCKVASYAADLHREGALWNMGQVSVCPSVCRVPLPPDIGCTRIHYHGGEFLWRSVKVKKPYFIK